MITFTAEELATEVDLLLANPSVYVSNILANTQQLIEYRELLAIFEANTLGKSLNYTYAKRIVGAIEPNLNHSIQAFTLFTWIICDYGKIPSYRLLSVTRALGIPSDSIYTFRGKKAANLASIMLPLSLLKQVAPDFIYKRTRAKLNSAKQKSLAPKLVLNEFGLVAFKSYYKSHILTIKQSMLYAAELHDIVPFTKYHMLYANFILETVRSLNYELSCKLTSIWENCDADSSAKKYATIPYVDEGAITKLLEYSEHTNIMLTHHTVVSMVEKLTEDDQTNIHMLYSVFGYSYSHRVLAVEPNIKLPDNYNGYRHTDQATLAVLKYVYSKYQILQDILWLKHLIKQSLTLEFLNCSKKIPEITPELTEFIDKEIHEITHNNSTYLLDEREEN